ncbi:hypothetical protein QMT40_003008 [Parvibaculaceae bacterium PLY_AMNH_Bact1]|nr:hypothetical protein QMT40_003008 [Parvibaculaceae bacterium PLY_AMNH_Bact1]
MGKRKPDQLFTIFDADGVDVGEVTARHRKGALTVARAKWGKANCADAKIKAEKAETEGGDV